ncbi:DUF502 domain-containing protein [Thiohalocapsa marina]|uniref:DUF502 domain-containing protein n=1 Tax=Thiohalocapsa marina TaxID=424902 RepID=A0A5M8FHH1_9GAMM|nr:DUF502 domain-containing protein [Thiohalocapsa marina]KAA6184177.1 DUF502 domain-containing protein [Thiohalocapsa marina]
MRIASTLARLRNLFLQGIALLAPLAITLALLVWLGRSAEQWMGQLLRQLLPEAWYLPGMGLAVGIGITLAAGLLANLFLVRWLLGLAERVIDRIPLIKTLFQGLKDVARFFGRNGDRQTLGRPVVVELQGARLVGFVMQEPAHLPLSGQEQDADHGQGCIAVYLPMSYQVGGYTLYLRPDQVSRLDVPTDQAMRAVLTGGPLSGSRTARRAGSAKDQPGS